MLWNRGNTDHLQSSNTNNILGLCERKQRGERGNKLDKKQKKKKHSETRNDSSFKGKKLTQ